MRAFRTLLLITAPVLLLSIAVLEFGVLRLLVPVDDFPREFWDATHRILKYRPDQTGVTYPSGELERPVPFTINVNGWNSHHPRYGEEQADMNRIAIIGDSYVAAFQVPPAASTAGRLETLLGAEENAVLAFGMNGAPLSQHLHIARFVSETYRPDAIVIALIHNDFHESYRPVPGRYRSSFLRLHLTDAAVEEIPPQPYRESPLIDWIRTQSATFRFVFYRLGIGGRTIRALYFRLRGQDAPRHEANVNVTRLPAEDRRARRATRYVFEKLAALRDSSVRPIYLVMDTPRASLYAGEDPTKSDAYELNRMAADLAEETGLPLIDLTDAFRRDYARHGERFEFPEDGHWNARAHALAADELHHKLTTQLQTTTDTPRRRGDADDLTVERD